MDRRRWSIARETSELHHCQYHQVLYLPLFSTVLSLVGRGYA